MIDLVMYSLWKYRHIKATIIHVFLTLSFLFRVIPEAGVAAEKPNKVKKLVFCSGKVFYDLRKARDDAGLSGDIAISRVEQVCSSQLCSIFVYEA